jgi:hypothetical protein
MRRCKLLGYRALVRNRDWPAKPVRTALLGAIKTQGGPDVDLVREILSATNRRRGTAAA